jgi:GTP pyrophosphokinase
MNRDHRQTPLFAPEGLSAGAVLHPELGGLLSRIAAYDSKSDPALIDAAYGIAYDAHATQKRDNGEPYITHPLAVANILAGYRLDSSTTWWRTPRSPSPRSKNVLARRSPGWSTA